MSKLKTIEVIITEEELVTVSMGYSYQMVPYILQKLRDAGIPVKGLLLFNGVSRGRLVQIYNIEDMSYTFRWVNA